MEISMHVDIWSGVYDWIRWLQYGCALYPQTTGFNSDVDVDVVHLKQSELKVIRRMLQKYYMTKSVVNLVVTKSMHTFWPDHFTSTDL